MIPRASDELATAAAVCGAARDRARQTLPDEAIIPV
jgi:hypothetical protein